MVKCVYLGMEDTLGLQTELVVVVWLVQNVFESQESYRTHRVPILPEDTDLQLTSLNLAGDDMHKGNYHRINL